ncbi:hypothetical protein FB45DRAFT_243541 [Roridomyces roridus]|uniref:Uncharacterized protein n=1 Tax=Roridomyces roridus TaxID=1738132 RepID=A0AAD7FFB6_9AGAR|nr:hypothetical protein FB45DRAFT_243541 [Roridomyces roridus]
MRQAVCLKTERRALFCLPSLTSHLSAALLQIPSFTTCGGAGGASSRPYLFRSLGLAMRYAHYRPSHRGWSQNACCITATNMVRFSDGESTRAFGSFFPDFISFHSIRPLPSAFVSLYSIHHDRNRNPPGLVSSAFLSGWLCWLLAPMRENSWALDQKRKGVDTLKMILDSGAARPALVAVEQALRIISRRTTTTTRRFLRGTPAIRPTRSSHLAAGRFRRSPQPSARSSMFSRIPYCPTHPLLLIFR